MNLNRRTCAPAHTDWVGIVSGYIFFHFQGGYKVILVDTI
jgi:hypothetical protein